MKMAAFPCAARKLRVNQSFLNAVLLVTAGVFVTVSRIMQARHPRYLLPA